MSLIVVIKKLVLQIITTSIYQNVSDALAGLI